LTIKTTASLA